MRIFVARDQSKADRLKILFDDIEENHHEAGLLLGYPRTAVEAFLTPDMLEMNDEPISTEDVSVENMRLLGHRLSVDNWRDEVKYLEKSGEYLKTISPTIYGSLIEPEV
ncbi:MAG: hypothetical protein ABIP50_03040 [Candidatus Saccharimonadales bacterium]